MREVLELVGKERATRLFPSELVIEKIAGYPNARKVSVVFSTTRSDESSVVFSIPQTERMLKRAMETARTAQKRGGNPDASFLAHVRTLKALKTKRDVKQAAHYAPTINAVRKVVGRLRREGFKTVLKLENPPTGALVTVTRKTNADEAAALERALERGRLRFAGKPLKREDTLHHFRVGAQDAGTVDSLMTGMFLANTSEAMRRLLLDELKTQGIEAELQERPGRSGVERDSRGRVSEVYLGLSANLGIDRTVEAAEKTLDSLGEGWKKEELLGGLRRLADAWRKPQTAFKTRHLIASRR